jgi:hypothetical protein
MFHILTVLNANTDDYGIFLFSRLHVGEYRLSADKQEALFVTYLTQGYDTAMPMKVKFWRWTLLFGAVGLFVPAVLLTRYAVFGTTFGEFEAKLWPSSLMLMALDSPNPRTVNIVTIYAMAFCANIILYAAVGVLTWPLVYAVHHLCGSRAGVPKLP